MNVSDEVRVFARRLSRRPLDRAAQKKRAIATPFFATEVPTLLSRRRAPPRGAPADPFRAFDARALFATVQERWTPLHSAASAGHAPVVASLLAFGAAPNAANSGGQRAAHYAASKGRVEVLRKLIHAGADCEARDATGATPMHRASSTGSTRIIEFLRTEGEADLETRNAVGQTPLLVACEADRREAVLLLARLGADVDAVDDEKNGAATFAPKLLPALRSIKQGDVA
mgnify:CR=1 FL=1